MSSFQYDNWIFATSREEAQKHTLINPCYHNGTRLNLEIIPDFLVKNGQVCKNYWRSEDYKSMREGGHVDFSEFDGTYGVLYLYPHPFVINGVAQVLDCARTDWNGSHTVKLTDAISIIDTNIKNDINEIVPIVTYSVFI